LPFPHLTGFLIGTICEQGVVGVACGEFRHLQIEVDLFHQIQEHFGILHCVELEELGPDPTRNGRRRHQRSNPWSQRNWSYWNRCCRDHHRNHCRNHRRNQRRNHRRNHRRSHRRNWRNCMNRRSISHRRKRRSRRDPYRNHHRNHRRNWRNCVNRRSRSHRRKRRSRRDPPIDSRKNPRNPPRSQWNCAREWMTRKAQDQRERHHQRRRHVCMMQRIKQPNRIAK
jgi:hypothetical protein